jgi:quercetin dioxygenase-like cupin family protein
MGRRLRDDAGVEGRERPKETAMIQAGSSCAINPGEETICVGPLTIRFLVTGDNSNGSAAVFELSVPAGEQLPAPGHSHDAYEETVYGLAGVLTWTVEGHPVSVGPGQALCIPRGIVHRFDNHGETAAKVLITVSPAGIGTAYFRDVAAVLAAAGDKLPDQGRMVEILRRHGLKPAPPRV